MPIPVENARSIFKKLTEEFFAEHDQEVKWGSLQPFNLMLWPRPTPHFFLAVYIAQLKDTNIRMRELERKFAEIDFPIEIKKKYDGMDRRNKNPEIPLQHNALNPVPPPNA